MARKPAPPAEEAVLEVPWVARCPACAAPLARWAGPGRRPWAEWAGRDRQRCGCGARVDLQRPEVWRPEVADATAPLGLWRLAG